MRIIAIIPAHLNSVRFPRKILLKIHGLEMIEHVRRRAILCGLFEEVYVSSCDEEILSLVMSHNGKVLKTGNNHLSGTSRIIEACEHIDTSHIVLIQGDEPLILPEQLREMCISIKSLPKVDAWNATAKLQNEEQLHKKSIVKCAINAEDKILYCFRKTPSFLPFDVQKSYLRKILGLIAFRKDVIMKFKNYCPSELEKSESIEQLRFIEKGLNLKSVQIYPSLPSINELEDYQEVLDFIKKSSNQQKILKKIL